MTSIVAPVQTPTASFPPAPRWKPETVLAVIAAGAMLFAVWPVVLAFAAAPPVDPAALTAHLSGMLAGYAAIMLVGLMSRAPALERGVGADVLARLHARGGRITMVLVAVHAGAAVLAWAGSRQVGLLTAITDVLQLPALPVAAAGTAIFAVIGVVSARRIRSRLPYEVWHLLHLLTYVALALSFVHELAGPDLVGHRWLQVGWSLLYAGVFGLLLRHRLLAPLRQQWRHRLKVVAVRPEGEGVVTIEVAGRHLEELQAESGQFFRWRFLSGGSWGTAHPFSLSAPPTGDRLRLTVKRLGVGSGRLQSLRVGTRLLAEGPYGAMTAARRTRRDVLLIAGGVGITPMRALLETMPIGPDQDLTLLYRARTADEVIFRGELNRIARERGATVRYLLGLDRACLSPAGLTALVPNLADRDVYLCGPAPMAAAVRTSVLAAGLPVRHLHEERFAF